MRLLLVILLFAHAALKAQTPGNGIVFQSSKKELSVSDGELSDLTIKVVNNTQSVLNATFSVDLPKGLDLVSRNNINLSVKSGDSLYIPVKIFVTQKVNAGTVNQIYLKLLDSEKKVIASDDCNLQVAIKKNMTLFSMVSNILLERNIDSIRIPVRISNMGNTVQKVTLVNRYASSVENGNFHYSVQLTIMPQKDTLVTFVKPVNSKMFNQEAFDVNITGLYANGELFGAEYIKIQSARSNRTYRDQSLDDSYDNNSISLSSQGLFRQNQVYLLQGRGIVELPGSKVAYNLDYTTYRNTDYSPSMLRNTYLGFETHNMGLRAGNINRNLDINLSGKGGMFYVNDTARNSRYEGGYISSSSNLFGNGNFTLFPVGEAAWGSFTRDEKKWRLASAAIYELNPMLKSRNMVLTNEFTWTGIKNFRITGSLNSGNTSEYDNNESGEYANTGNSKLSFASGLDISGSVNRWIFNSVNYISSGYYPGTRRGALNFSERVTLTRSSSQIWVNVDYYKYTPKFFLDEFLFEPSFSNLRADIGWSQKIFGIVTLSVAPYYAVERNNSFQFLGTNSLVLRSWNVLTTLNIPISTTRYISINAEGGVFNSSLEAKSGLRFRTNSNYRHGIFNLMASAQIGTYYLGEILSSYLTKAGSNYIINVSPTVQKTFLRNKLRTEMGINYSNIKASGRNWQLTGRTEYDVMSKTTLFASMNHSRYTFFGSLYTSSILEVGIRKNMRSAKLGAKINPLEVFVFKDINQNGVYDTGDSIATNHLVYINEEVFVTKADGTVIYKNLPPGEYRITLPRLKGWSAPDQKINFEKKERIDIPLQKTGTLRGHISYEYDEFSYEIGQQKEGMKITAISGNGQSYVTRTVTDGSYTFFIPAGKYTVHINGENLPAEVENIQGDQYVDIVPGEARSVNLILTVKRRKIETKKFVSPSLRR
ncbi:hypothetical protein [Pedobacter frigoris]|uniref:COG1470 family protein n=1 Tax=Pedobacter frigoris TaxID=2571272 RepID=UPI00292EEB17|nr:hypothetical protein [Pedobacter frigoris]